MVERVIEKEVPFKIEALVHDHNNDESYRNQ